MWRLARVTKHQWSVGISVWDSSGRQGRSLKSNHKKDEDRQDELWSLYHQAITDFLKDGWEPFNTGDQPDVVWFRMKVEV